VYSLAGVHPAVGVNSLGSVDRVVEVALEDVLATEAELTTRVGLVEVGVLDAKSVTGHRLRPVVLTPISGTSNSLTSLQGWIWPQVPMAAASSGIPLEQVPMVSVIPY